MIHRIPIVIVLLLSAIAFAGQTRSTLRGNANDAPSRDLWRITPPPPQISEANRLAELSRRRQEVMNRLGESGILVLFSAEPRVYANDVDYPYRQENNLYYLTGINQEGATLVLIPGAKKTREILFLPPRIPAREVWEGKMLSNADAQARSGIKDIRDAALFRTFIGFISPQAREALGRDNPISQPDERQQVEWRDDFGGVMERTQRGEAQLYLLTIGQRELPEYRQEYRFVNQISSVSGGFKVQSAMPIFRDLRARKSPWEVSLIQHAVDITGEAFQRAFAFTGPGVHEYEIQAEFEYTFRRRHADNWGYPCIIGGGANSTTLHYMTNQDPLPGGGVLLMDCGAEYDHYSCDVTRTIPINGKFSKEQAEIYNIVYQATQEAIKLARPGNMIGGGRTPGSDAPSVHGRALEIVKDGLLRLGLITSKDNNEYRTWFMHGTSHWLGMNVHDVGDYTKPLTPGNVLTVEPGIYVRPDALDVLPKTPENERFIAAVRPAFEKYKGIGIRIEEDVLITEAEPRVMSIAIPSRLEEVETTMARLKRSAGTQIGRILPGSVR